MKLIVWGTGKLYQKYKSFLLQFELVKLCDSALVKKGSYLDGIEVISPSQLKKFQYDYVVIMAYATEEIYCQIKSLEIPKQKVILYSQLWYLEGSDVCIHSKNATIGLNDWIEENQKSILLISHNFSYTGISVALKNMANVLRGMGYSVLMAAMDGGSFIKELLSEKIDYIDNLEMGYQTEYFENLLQQVAAVVLGTLDLYRLGSVIGHIKTPTIWWIHETYERYYMGKERLPKRDDLRFFAGGNRVKEVFISHYKNVVIQKLQYCIPDHCKKKKKENKNTRMTVALIGTVDERKAQDILLKAVTGMQEDYRNQLKVVLVGKNDESNAVYAKKIKEQSEYLDDFEWIPEMTQAELEEFYFDIDILVCPSRDDPMPVVVTQAMMHEKVCVISQNVGQAEFIKQQVNGFVFPDGDAEALGNILIWLLDNRDQCAVIGKASREIYEGEFSEKVMEQKLSRVLEELHVAKGV